MICAIVTAPQLCIGDLVAFPDGVGPKIWRVGRIEVLADGRRRITWANAPAALTFWVRRDPWAGVYGPDAILHRLPKAYVDKHAP